MALDFDNDRPLYIQLVEVLKLDIISGKYKPGEKLPSVRELAYTNKVNPNTMQKAMTELENYELVYTQRTSGRFVTNEIEKINKLKVEMVRNKVTEFLTDMEAFGFDREDIMGYINRGDE